MDQQSPDRFEYKGLPIQLERKPRRRNMSLRLKPGHPVYVRGNMSLTRKQAEAMLQMQWEWVQKNWRKLQELPQAKELTLRHGEAFWFLGQQYFLQKKITPLKKAFIAAERVQHQVAEGLGPSIDGLDSVASLHLFWPMDWPLSVQSLEGAAARTVFKQFLQREAAKVILPRVELLATRMDLKPEKVRFKYLRSRWGSCTSRGTVTLNSRLLSAPLWVIDSVVVHELAHLVHMNHSRDFWSWVEQFAPDHKKADQWLRHHSPPF